MDYHPHADGKVDSLTSSPDNPFSSSDLLEMVKPFLRCHLSEMETWLLIHHLLRLYRDGAVFSKELSLEMEVWIWSPHLLRHLHRWCRVFQRIISGDGNLVFKPRGHFI